MKEAELLRQNIEKMKKERERLISQNGKEIRTSREVIGGDVYDRHGTINTTKEIEALDKKIKECEKAYQAACRNIREEKRAEHISKEREQEKEYKSKMKYTYGSGEKVHKTNNPALAARYDAQHRFFGMSKTKQSLSKLTGQWKKFDKLWKKADSVNLSVKEQEEVAAKLNSMFKR